MRRPPFIKCWRVFTVILFLLLCAHIYQLSKESFYKLDPGKIYQPYFEIDLCYKTNIGDGFCKTLNGPDAKIPKKPFSDSGCFQDSIGLQDPIGCYTSGFELKTASEIIREFKRCNTSFWPTIDTKKEEVTNIATEHLLFGGFICLRRNFRIENENKTSKYVIRSENFLKFNAYVTYFRDYESDGGFRSKKNLLFSRDCWKTKDGRSKCTETDKKLVFDVKHYSIKFLEHPINSNCAYRKKANLSITQNDCYEDCIKKEKKFHLLTYHEDDDFPLDYANTSDLRPLLEQCAASCQQEDCQITGIMTSFHSGDSYKRDALKSERNGSFIINISARVRGVRYEEVPLLTTAKLLWIFFALVSTCFGLNLYGLLTKTSNLYQSRQSKRSKKRKKNWNKQCLSTVLFITIMITGLSLILEHVCFNFGKITALVRVSQESITDRNVSVSICFNLCEILKDDLKEGTDCNDGLLYRKNIKELNEITWSVKDFKSRASMRNGARVYPIRQEDFDVPMFFRNFKKCFLLYYTSTNQWPHLPMQQASFVHIKITGPPRYAYFFIEDGYRFPRIDANPTENSVLHGVWEYVERSRDGCINYEDYGHNSLKTKDDFIQNCVVTNRTQDKTIPTNVNLKIEGNLSEYADFRFSNNSTLRKSLFEYCSIDKTIECTQVSTKLTPKRLNEEKDEISVNLTPGIYKNRPLEDESVLVSLNRIISFLIFFTGFSVKEFSKAIISFYFPNVLSNSQLTKRLVYLSLSFLFLIHFCFLFHEIIHQPMLVGSHITHANEVWQYVFRLCYNTGFDLDKQEYTFEKLEANTLNLSDIFQKISFYNEMDEITKLDFQNFTFRKNHLVDSFQLYCCGNNTQVVLNEMYLDNMKCFNFYFPSEEKNRLNFRSLKLNKLFLISFSFREFAKRHLAERIFILFNRVHVYSFALTRAYEPADYVFQSIAYVNSYSDDYWHIKAATKNLALYLSKLIGWSQSIDSLHLYLLDIKAAFIAEQGVTNSLIPIFWNDQKDPKDLVVKNKQFNYYMQFRAMATKRNEFDFTRNTEKVTLVPTFYLKKQLEEQDHLTVTVHSSLIKIVEKSRNRFPVVELFLHLFISISFWFRVDVISLPVSLKNAFPIFKLFALYFFYYIVSFLVYLFDLWFAFVRFLKFKSD